MDASSASAHETLAQCEQVIAAAGGAVWVLDADACEKQPLVGEAQLFSGGRGSSSATVYELLP